MIANRAADEENWDEDFDFHNESDAHDASQKPVLTLPVSPPRRASVHQKQQQPEAGPSTPRRPAPVTENWDDDFLDSSNSPARSTHTPSFPSPPRAARTRARPPKVRTPQRQVSEATENWDIEFGLTQRSHLPNRRASMPLNALSDTAWSSDDSDGEDKTVTARARRIPLSRDGPPPVPPIPMSLSSSALTLDYRGHHTPPRSPAASSTFSIPLSRGGYGSTTHLALRKTRSGASSSLLPSSPQPPRERRRLRKKSRPERGDDLFELRSHDGPPPGPSVLRKRRPTVEPVDGRRASMDEDPVSDHLYPADVESPLETAPEHLLSDVPGTPPRKDPQPPPPGDGAPVPSTPGRTPILARIGSVKRWGLRKKRASMAPSETSPSSTPRPPSRGRNSLPPPVPHVPPALQHEKSIDRLRAFLPGSPRGRHFPEQLPQSNRLSVARPQTGRHASYAGSASAGSSRSPSRSGPRNPGPNGASVSTNDLRLPLGVGRPQTRDHPSPGTENIPHKSKVEEHHISEAEKLLGRVRRLSALGRRHRMSKSLAELPPLPGTPHDSTSELPLFQASLEHSHHTPRPSFASQRRPSDAARSRKGSRAARASLDARASFDIRRSIGDRPRNISSNSNASEHSRTSESSRVGRSSIGSIGSAQDLPKSPPRRHSSLAHRIPKVELLPPIELQPPSPPSTVVPGEESISSLRRSIEALRSQTPLHGTESAIRAGRISTSPTHVASLGRSTVQPRENPALRRNSLGDLKIPARISQAQIGLRRDLGMLRDFATSVENLKHLQIAYMELFSEAQAILSNPPPPVQESSPPLSRRFSRGRSNTNPQPPAHTQLASGLHALTAKYRLAWECAELLIELGGGNLDRDSPPVPSTSTSAPIIGTDASDQVRPNRERAVTLAGENAISVQSVPSPSNEARPQEPGWRASTGRNDLSKRQLVLLRDMLASPAVPEEGRLSPTPSHPANTAWRWDNPAGSTMTLPPAEESLQSAPASTPLRKKYSGKLAGMRGLRDMLKALTRSHNTESNSTNASPSSYHPRSKNSSGAPSLRSTHEGSQFGTTTTQGPGSFAHKLSPRRPSLASIFRLGQRHRQTPPTSSSDNLQSMRTASSGAHSHISTGSEDWDRLDSASDYEVDPGGHTIGPDGSATIRIDNSRNSRRQSPYLASRNSSEIHSRSSIWGESSPTAASHGGGPVRLSNVEEVPGAPTMRPASALSRRASGRGNPGSIRTSAYVPHTPSARSHSAPINRQRFQPDPQLAMTPENIGPLLENAREVQARLTDCVGEMRGLLSRRASSVAA